MDQTKKELIVFTAACFALLWIPCGLFIFYKEPLTAVFTAIFGESVPPFVLLYLGAYSPTLVAFVLTAFWSGRSGLKEFLARSFRWREHWKWWVIAFAAIPGSFLIKSLITFPLGAPLDFSLWYSALPLVLLSGYLFIDTGPLGEEFGLRGYALPRLLKLMSPLWATLVLGMFWSVWHLPAFFSADINPIHASSTFWIFLFAPLGVAMLQTWIHINTRGSVLLSGIIPHMMTNATGAARIHHPLTDAAALVVWLSMGLAVYLLARKDFLRKSEEHCYIGR